MSHPAVLALIALHLAGMHAASPPGTVFAIDASGLADPSVTVMTAWEGDALAGMAALRMMGDHAAEVKSMRTHPAYLRRGVAAALLAALIAEARARQLRTLSLETGSGAEFEPAVALYRKNGFVSGAPFGSYTVSDFNQFLHLAL